MDGGGDERLRRRLRVLESVRAAISRLHEIDSVERLVPRALEEMCRATGLDRALLFRVQDSEMVADSIHWPTRPEEGAKLLATAQGIPAHLDHLLLETEMIRRRGPVLVSDPLHDPRSHKELVLLFRTSSYVAAPIMPGGRVVGFLHADRDDQGVPVDEDDRDALWAFTEGFGFALDRAILLERLRAQRLRMSEALAAIEATMAEIGDAAPSLVRPAHAVPAPARAQPLALTSLLTRRELEVLGLMADGNTNAGIAARLVISPTTVKSHVKAVLRKLQAANRAEAVARYMRYSMASTGSENSMSASSVVMRRP